LQGIPFELVTPKEIGIVMDVDETGATYGKMPGSKPVTWRHKAVC